MQNKLEDLQERFQAIQIELRDKDEMLGRFQNSDEVQKNEESTLKKGHTSTKDVETQTEVCVESVSTCSYSSYIDDHVSIGSFEKHTLWARPKFLTKMDYKGGGLAVNGQGITQPLEVKEIP